jgi:glycosyltransferase involved in cell wall biosynthesis
MVCREEANLSAALECGVQTASNDAILFMDADCQFEPGTIDLLYAAMVAGGAENNVYKGSVCFDKGRGYLSRLIARSRHVHTTAPPTAFKPPLLVHRCLTPRIGGYFFDSRLLWKEDADLDWRLREAGVAVEPVANAHIRHAALDICTDLRSNYRYGVGAALGKIMAIPLTTPDRSLRRTLQSEGIAVAGYMSLANLARGIGYRWTLVMAAVRGSA